MGLNAFRVVVHEMYPLFLEGPVFDLAHAHNIYLQTALDGGVPALVAYLATIGLALTMAWQCSSRARGAEGALALGLFGTLVAGQTFGLGDAVALGAKIGLFFWWNLGLIAAVFYSWSDGARSGDAPAASIDPVVPRCFLA
jgi:putative inorganic carbon (HCO3(-)) transporter